MQESQQILNNKGIKGTAFKRTEHLKDYLRILIARRWLVISGFSLIVLSVTAYVLVATPIFRSEAVLLIEPAKLNLTDFKEVYDPTLGGVGGELSRREFYRTQHKLIVSRPSLARTFEKFEFAKMSKFRDKKEPIEDFEKLFSVNPVRRTRLVNVTFDWKDPELAARVLDSHIHDYIMSYRQRSLGVSLGGIETLRKKAEELKPRVAAAADELQQFMVVNNMVSLERSQNIVVERLKEISKNLTVAENELFGYQSIIDNIRLGLAEKRPLEDMPEMADSKIIQDLKLEYIRSKQELVDISGRFGPNHPEVIAIGARLSAINQKIEVEMGSIMASARAKLERAVTQTENLRKELSEQEQNVMDLNKIAGKYNTLKESHETLKGTYNAVDKRIKEIEISLAAGSQGDNIFIIQNPSIPVKHTKPKRFFAVALSCVMGLIVSTGLAFFVDYLDTTIKTKDETESVLGTPVIGFVPGLTQNHSGQSNGRKPIKPVELEAVEKPRSPLAESFKSIRTALEFSSGDGDRKHMLVTSASPGEGKTLTSVNVAITLAQAGNKTLLVDADMRKPRLHKLFRITSKEGLSNFLVTGEKSGIKVFFGSIRAKLIRPAVWSNAT